MERLKEWEAASPPITVERPAFEPGRRAAVVVPFQHLVDRAGAYAVFGSELVALRRAGFTIELTVALPTLDPSRGRLARMREAAEAAAGELGANRVTCATGGSPWRHPLALAKVLRARARRSWPPNAELALARLIGSGTRRGRAADLIVCNYLSTIELADRLGPRERQVLVLHDWSPVRCVRRVRRALQRPGRIVCINPDDAARLAADNPSLVIEGALPPVAATPASAADLRAYGSLGEILQSCGASRPCPAASANATLDLLFVGGSHPPNVRGLKAFLSECYLPRLAPLGITFAIAGEVADSLDPGIAGGERLFLLGRVARLRPLYAAARLVVVPLLDGTGVSVKLLEALAYGKPVLASPAGLRGFGGITELALPPPFDARWAAAIRALLDSPTARREQRDRLLAATGIDRVAARFAAAIGAACGGGSACRVGPAPARVDELVEWMPAHDCIGRSLPCFGNNC